MVGGVGVAVRGFGKALLKAKVIGEKIKRKVTLKEQKLPSGKKEEVVFRDDPIIYQAYKKRFGKDKDQKILKPSGWVKKLKFAKKD